MKAKTFNQVNDLSNAKDDSKMAKYINLAREFAHEAAKIAKENEGSFMMMKSSEEVISYMRKVESADCEYTAYINAHSAEKWLEKMVTRQF